MNDVKTLHVVFDCNTFIQAIAFSDGPAGMAFRLAEAGAFKLCVSKAVLAELRRVLTYEEVLAMSPNMTPLRIDAFFKRLTSRAVLHRRVRRAFNFERDPKDAPYLDLSLAAKATYLVTRDNDLLSLMSAHSVFAKQFRRQTRPLSILNPVAFLAEMERRRGRERR